MKHNTNRDISQVQAGIDHLRCSERSVQRMLDRGQLHSQGEGKHRKLGREEVERVSPIMERFGPTGLPRYRGVASGTLWPTTIVADMVGVSSQTVNNWRRGGILTGSSSPHQSFIDQESLDSKFPGVVNRFLGSINSW